MGLVWWEPCLGDLQLWSAELGIVWWEPCLWGFAALVGSSGPRLVAAVSMGICSFGRLWASGGSSVELCLCCFGRQFWVSFGGSRMGICKLWSAVMGLVWCEPCLWGFAALVGSDGPRLVGAVSIRICSFGRQFWASFGGSRVYADLQALVGSLVGAVYGDLQLWSAVLGLVWWEPCLCGFASFGRQFWASFGGSRVYENLQALVGSDGPRLVGAVSTAGICRSAVMGEPCLWGFASFGRQFWASFDGSRVYVDLQALVGSSGPRLVGAVSMAICKLWSAVLGLVWWEPCLWGFASFGRQFWASFGGSRVYENLQALVGSSGPCLVGAVSMGICNIGRQFRASFGASRVYEDLQALVGSSGPRLVYGPRLWASFGGSRVYGDLQLWSAVMGFVWWELRLWGFAALVGSSGPLVGAVLGFAALVGSDGPRLVGAVSMRICKLWSAVLGLVWWEPCL